MGPVWPGPIPVRRPVLCGSDQTWSQPVRTGWDQKTKSILYYVLLIYVPIITHPLCHSCGHVIVMWQLSSKYLKKLLVRILANETKIKHTNTDMPNNVFMRPTARPSTRCVVVLVNVCHATNRSESCRVTCPRLVMLSWQLLRCRGSCCVTCSIRSSRVYL